MAIQLKNMKGTEFVKKILKGERDFSGIKLERGFNLSGYDGFAEMNDYLKNQDLSQNPVQINDSDFSYVKANGIYLPLTQGVRANLNRANLNRANLNRANLNRANLYGANLYGANLDGANLNRANLSRANLDGANLNRVMNLERAIYLEYAHFLNTIVTEKEKKIIEKARESIKLFDVRS